MSCISAAKMFLSLKLPIIPLYIKKAIQQDGFFILSIYLIFPVMLLPL